MNKRLSLFILSILVLLPGCQVNSQSEDNSLPTGSLIVGQAADIPEDKKCFSEVESSEQRILVNTFDFPGGFDTLFRGTLSKDSNGCVGITVIQDNMFSILSFPHGTVMDKEAIKLPDGRILKIGDSVNLSGAINSVNICQGTRPVGGETASKCDDGKVLRLNDDTDSVKTIAG